ncbi:hypothetical protein [Agromyces bauzanensis]
MAQALTTRDRVATIRQVMATERFRWWLAFAVLTMMAAARAALPTERDPFWSARAGLETLDGVPLARPDTWSWSAEGLWYPNSPAWNVVLGLGWSALGWWGFFWIAFIAMTALIGLSMVVARRAGARALPTFVTFVPLLLASSAALSARATVAVQILLLCAVLFAWWFGGVASRLPAAVLASVVVVAGFVLSFVGNWVHLSFMLLAAAVAVMWAVAWWASPGLDGPRRAVLAISGTLGLFLGCVLSPYGIGLTLERSRVVGEICKDLITEWMSLPTMVARQGGFIWLPIALVTVAAAAASVAWFVRLLRTAGRFDPRVRLVAPLLVLAVPAIAAGFGTLRFLALGALVLMPAAAGAMTALVDRLRQAQQGGAGAWSSSRAVTYTSGRFWTDVLVAVAVMFSVSAAVMIPQGARPPEAPLAEQLPRGCLLWSDPSVAGPVLLIRPDVKVWIDGRADFYGRAHLIEFLEVRAGNVPLPAEADCIILKPRSDDARLAEDLDAAPEWSRAAGSEAFTLWVRERG